MYEIGTEVTGSIDDYPFRGKVVEVDQAKNCYLIEYVSGPKDGATQWFVSKEMNNGLENA